MSLNKYNVSIRRFDPKNGSDSGETFVLPVDSPDEEHAISSTLANCISWTTKVRLGVLLDIAFTCVGIEKRNESRLR